jgi:hypothetical protein
VERKGHEAQIVHGLKTCLGIAAGVLAPNRILALWTLSTAVEHDNEDDGTSNYNSAHPDANPKIQTAGLFLFARLLLCVLFRWTFFELIVFVGHFLDAHRFAAFRALDLFSEKVVSNSEISPARTRKLNCHKNSDQFDGQEDSLSESRVDLRQRLGRFRPQDVVRVFQ